MYRRKIPNFSEAPHSRLSGATAKLWTQLWNQIRNQATQLVAIAQHEFQVLENFFGNVSIKTFELAERFALHAPTMARFCDGSAGSQAAQRLDRFERDRTRHAMLAVAPTMRQKREMQCPSMRVNARFRQAPERKPVAAAMTSIVSRELARSRLAAPIRTRNKYWCGDRLYVSVNAWMNRKRDSPAAAASAFESMSRK